MVMCMVMCIGYLHVVMLRPIDYSMHECVALDED